MTRGNGRHRRGAPAPPADPEAARRAYMAERARLQRQQGQARPRDPQQTTTAIVPDRHGGAVLIGPDIDPSEVVAWAMELCACRHEQIVHELDEDGKRAGCTITEGNIPCGCRRYHPKFPPDDEDPWSQPDTHDWGPAGRALRCARCGTPFPDTTGPCRPRDGDPC